LDVTGLPSSVTHWRRLTYWQKKASLWPVWRLILTLLTGKSLLGMEISELDGTLVPSFDFSQLTGYSGKHRRTGTKVSAAVDRDGLPLAIGIAPGNTHDLSMAVPN